VYQFIKKDDKTDCSNYRGMSLLSTSYNILSNILLSRLIRVFRPIKSTTDQVFHICQIKVKYLKAK
jgi:hypothetical protein